MSLGINCKWWDPGMYGMVWGVIILNLLFMFSVLAYFEIRHQRILSESDELYTSNEMDMATFQKEVTQNFRKFVILDNYVIDVADFIEHHPGGQFVLKHNIGRNISKFFHGSY